MKYQYELIILLLVTPILSIDVFPDFEIDCKTNLNETKTPNITHALQQTQKTDMALRLQEPGCYYIGDYSPINDARNFSIIGSGNASDYVITCDKNVSLVFTRVEGLELRNLLIQQCGVSGNNVQDFVDEAKTTIDLFYNIPSEIGYGILLADCSNVEVSGVTVQNTVGIGIFGLNIIGISSFTNLKLLNNWAPLCYFKSLKEVTSKRAIGGGMYLLYQDYISGSTVDPSTRLSINSTYMYNNSYCASFGNIGSLYGSSKTANQIGYTAGSSGALGISLAQLNYSVNVTVASSEFKNNTGWTSAGVHVTVFSGIRESDVTFDNCLFHKNGYEDYSYRPFGIPTVASGLLIFNNAPFPNETIHQLCDLGRFNRPAKITIMNSEFIGNKAAVCANIEIVTFRSPFHSLDNHSVISFENCTMRENQGSVGPVLCAITTDATAQYTDIDIQLNNIIIINNTVHSSNGKITFNLVESSGNILLVSTKVHFGGICLISENSGAAIISIASDMYFNGNITFSKNKGIFGGAMRLQTESHIVLTNNTHLSFIKNEASVQGGAIYNSIISTTSFIVIPDCFLYFEYIDVLCNYSSCPKITNMEIKLIFDGNTSPLGSTVFGSTLNGCPWYYELKHTATHNENIKTGLQLLTLFPDKFHFDPPLVNASVISTSVADLHINGEVNDTILLRGCPGEKLSFDVLAYDSFGYRTSTTILSSSENTSTISATLGDSVYWFLKSVDQNGTKTPLNILGLESGSAVVDLFSADSFAHISFNITAEPCGYVFEYDPVSESCFCPKSVQEKGVVCDISTQRLSVPDNHWIGPLTQKGDVKEYKSCFYDYCRPGIKNFKADDIDQQCNGGYNRTGLVCSQCMPRTGAVFGTSRCQSCTNIGLLWIPGLALAGIVIIFGVSFLSITVAEGYVNGFILYCNCINYFTVYLSPQFPNSFIFAPTAWVNLAIGIESCFYKDMSTLARVGLRLIFPFYLFFLMGLVIIIARYCRTPTRMLFSASKTFATLLMLCYFSILGTCVEILGVSQFNGINNNVSYTGWLLDSSVPYGHGVHGLLVFVAIVLMIFYVIPMPILLLFPGPLYSWRFTQRFKPIYDAFWNPYKPKFRFWLGIRALFRLIPFSLALYCKHPINIFAFAITMTIGWFIQERISPYDGFWRNGFDSFFMVNLILLLLGNMYYERYRDEELSFPKAYRDLVYILLLVAYMAFIAIVVIHVFIRFPKLKLKLSNFFDCCWKKTKSHLSTVTINNSVFEDDFEPQEKDKLAPPRAVTFTEFREPLLDDIDYGSVNRDQDRYTH